MSRSPASRNPRPASPRSPSLLDLPHDVLLSIAQLLTITEKLTHFTHIHRALPRLTPVAFKFDWLRLHVAEQPMPAHLQPLLASVSSLSYYWESKDERNSSDLDCTAFCSLLTAPSHSVSSPFVNLRHLALRLSPTPSLDDDEEDVEEEDDDGDDEEMGMGRKEAKRTVADVFSSPNAFPHLTSLQLSGWLRSAGWFRSALSCLPSLRKIVLVGWRMKVADLLAVLRLPQLEHVEVRCFVEHDEDGVSACGCLGEVSLLVNCHTLRLPLGHWKPEHCPVGHRAVIAVLYQQLAMESRDTAADGRQRWQTSAASDEEKQHPETIAGLQRLSVFSRFVLSVNDVAAMTSIASIRSLRAVDFDSVRNMEAMAAFADAASPSILPHLRDLRCAAAKHIDSVTGAVFDAAHAVLCCVNRFASQLRVLQLTVQGDEDVTAELFTVVQQCSQLRRLRVCEMLAAGSTFVPRRCALAVVTSPPLLHLHSLIIDRAHIAKEQLIDLLHRCPALEDVQLCTPDLSLAILSALCQHQRLRRLSLLSHWERFNDGEEVAALRQLVAASTTQPMFSSLSCLRVHWTWEHRAAGLQLISSEPRLHAGLNYSQYQTTKEPEQYPFLGHHSEEQMALLPAALHSAPLRHLHLGGPYNGSNLHLFATLSQLRVLLVIRSVQLETMVAALRVPHVPFSLPIHRDDWSECTMQSVRPLWDDEAEDGGEEADSDIAMAEEEKRRSGRDWNLLALCFRDEDERAAFFAEALRGASTPATASKATKKRKK